MQRSPRSSQLTRLTALILATAFLGGCDLSGISDITGGELQKISLTGPSVVEVGDTIRLEATGQVSGLIGIFSYDRMLDARFKVSDATVASISPFIPPSADTMSVASVLVQGLRVERVGITVSARGKSETHTVDVVAASP